MKILQNRTAGAGSISPNLDLRLTIRTVRRTICLEPVQKSARSNGERLHSDEKTSASLGRRLDPPIPATYFGNCVKGQYVVPLTKELVGKDGFIYALERIVEAFNMVNLVSTDNTGAFSMSESRDINGGIEIGLMLPKSEIDVT
ncbi:hypothetical protein V8G54_012848 [Vigna mungo]|uniref:Uncharacterized protein n=1 Tax=Vigna mungo TaxID=3915 RepID=A0AAQ3NUL2_VIGMU